MNKYFWAIFTVGLIVFNSLAVQASDSFKPKEGYVPDEKTAIAIAVAVWIPIYGEKKIENEKPFVATLKDGVWFVRGTLPPDWVGGTAMAEIAKDDGKIIRVIHEM